MDLKRWLIVLVAGSTVTFVAASPTFAQTPTKKPNVVVLMGDDLGWSDFGAYTGGGKALGHPTPNIDRRAREGAVFTSWYGQSSCTAGRSSFQTGRIPINDLPFGGIGNSGMGSYHGEEGFRELSHAKAMFKRHRWFPIGLFYPPYGNLVQRLVLKFYLG